MKKIVLLPFCLAMTVCNVFAINFSAPAPTGQELWYATRGSFPQEVILTYPSNEYKKPYEGFSEPSGNLIIPEYVTYEGISYKVTAIGGYAFYNCSNLQSVTIQNSIGAIYQKAFGGCTSAIITISEDVKTYATDAFDGCHEIKDNRILKPTTITKDNKNVPSQSPRQQHISIYSSEEEIMEEIDKQNDGIVGIYRDISTNTDLSVIKENDNYIILYIKGSEPHWRKWHCGDLKAELTPSATFGLFQAKWYMSDYTINNQCIIVFDGSTMKVVTSGQEMTLLKMYPAAVAGGEVSKASSWSGTGFAIADGYIVTNNHVVDGAKNINLKGVKGDLTTSFSAKVVATDANNDIAIIKITDNSFAGFGNIPYGVSSNMAESGEEIFVLGYPMTQALGNEIKLTNGIVSSRTGYQGDVATYQISAPVQPGNSGGPMFNNKGNVIGIVVAGVPGAENVGYAIKTSYLKNLIESARLTIKFPANNTISTLSLTDKVKHIRNFVYYIECSK